MNGATKRILAFGLPVVLVLAGVFVLASTVLGGSGEDRHPDWDESWVRMAEYIGVEPVEGFTLNEHNDTLYMAAGIYYATWTTGEGRDYTNAEGESATVYDAQIYMLLEECYDAEGAEAAIGKWTAREKQAYEAGESDTKAYAGQDFQVLPLLSGREGNPYPSGAAAFAARDKWAISVELVCSDRFTGDAQLILEQFLTGLHYSEE